VVRSRDGIAPTYSDTVLISRRHKLVLRATALPNAEENVIVLLLLMHNSALHHSIPLRRVADDGPDFLLTTGPALDLHVVAELDLLDAGPVGAESKVQRLRRVILLKDERIDEIVASVLRETDDAMVRPGTGDEGRGGGNANFRVVGADEGYGVVTVPG
jgi:hypothetical protein